MTWSQHIRNSLTGVRQISAPKSSLKKMAWTASGLIRDMKSEKTLREKREQYIVL